MIRVGVVVQRYGPDVVGGAETLARDVSERLNAGGCDVTVFTTTAKDYITWSDHYSAGDSILKGVVIKRFPVDEERDIESFNHYSETFFSKNSESRDEEEWIRKQGPYAPRLLEAIEREQDDFDLFLFFTYLYYPTVEGVKLIKKPLVLFPTAHDEAPIYLEAMKNVFVRPDSFMFLTGAEMDFVKKTFAPAGKMNLVRTGLPIRDGVTAESFKKKYKLLYPYMLYAGRIERGKGLETLFAGYRHVRARRLLYLVLIGKQLMDIPDEEGIRYLGYVSEGEKLAAFRGAMLSVQPSPYESLSITTLESFSQRCPVLVNRQSEVLMEHVRMSGGGLAYADDGEFCHNFLQLYDNRRQRLKMGTAGYEYVRQYFNWETVISEIKAELDRLTGG